MKNGEWRYASHVPLIKGLLDMYKPNYVLELGCGMYSTSLFLAYTAANADTEYHGIDNDMEWINQIKETFGVPITYHDLEGIDRSTVWGKLTTSQRIKIQKYYAEIAFGLNDVQPKLLFVDGYACTRKIAIEMLKGYFDVIVYHDSQPKRNSRVFNHSYNQNKEVGFTKYHLSSIGNWTSVMVKEDKGISALRESVVQYINEFYEQWNRNVGMKIVQL